MPVDIAANAIVGQAALAISEDDAMQSACNEATSDEATCEGSSALNKATAAAAAALPATPIRVLNLDAMAFGLQPRRLATLLDEIDDAAREAGKPPLRRELPYGLWRRLAAAAGPPASLALAMLPPEGKGGVLRLPSGARRRLRDTRRSAAQARA